MQHSVAYCRIQYRKNHRASLACSMNICMAHEFIDQINGRKTECEEQSWRPCKNRLACVFVCWLVENLPTGFANANGLRAVLVIYYCTLYILACTTATFTAVVHSLFICKLVSFVTTALTFIVHCADYTWRRNRQIILLNTLRINPTWLCMIASCSDVPLTRITNGPSWANVRECMSAGGAANRNCACGPTRKQSTSPYNQIIKIRNTHRTQ